MAEALHAGPGPGSAADDAGRAAEGWASKLGVEIETVDAERAAREAVGVLARVWPQPNGHLPLTPELAWALAHSGNYVAVARAGDDPVAAAVAFRAMDAAGAHVHSHMVGVLPAHQGASVGFALKLHQRAWALDAGLDRITWTFDPLVARNAYFNVMKLGARLTSYYVDFYGELTDGINAGDASDRCLATWQLDDARAARAAAGTAADCDVAALLEAGATEVLGPGADGRPAARPARSDGPRLVRVPDDIVAVRRSDPAAARAWREALRDALLAAFDDGLAVTAVSRDGCYVISAA